MSLEKFRRVEDMPSLPAVTGPALPRRIRAILRRSRLFAPRRVFRLGVQRFRSVREKQESESGLDG